MEYKMSQRLQNTLSSLVIVPAEVIASALQTTPAKIKSGILNGTLPIGSVMNEGGRDRVVIIEERVIAWAKAMDLKGSIE